MNRMAQVVRAGEELWRKAVRQAFRIYDWSRHQFETARRYWLEPGESETGTRARIVREVPARIPDNVRVYAIGDIHGRADLLGRLMDLIDEDAATAGQHEKVIMVFLGDYVDRGFQSREVIDFILSERLAAYETVFLKGNHEEAFLKFLSDAGFGPDWARYGGSETLTSYGIRPPRSRTLPEEWVEACARLNEVLPDAHRNFLISLRPSVTIGDYMFVHAGVRPDRALDQQSERDLLWIRDRFLNDATCFEQVIVHGHTPIREPYRDDRRIGIDTGAYLSGRLTATRLMADDVTFFTT